jgi:hypothetical protein
MNVKIAAFRVRKWGQKVPPKRQYLSTWVHGYFLEDRNLKTALLMQQHVLVYRSASAKSTERSSLST